MKFTFKRSQSLLYRKLIVMLEAEKRRREENNTRYDWSLWARANQKLPSGDWFIWLIMAGRGFGKTRTGAETIRHWVYSGHKRIALIGQTYDEGRQIMVEGVSGLLSIYPASERPIFEASKRQVAWENGAIAQIFSAESPEKLRGPQFEVAWIDELAKFSDPEAVFDQLMFGLRLGKKPRVVITTTPRSHPFIQELLTRKDCIITQGTTFDNERNLSPEFLSSITQRYNNTALGAQELLGQIIEAGQKVFWRPSDIFHLEPDKARSWREDHRRYGRIVLAIDPAVSHHANSDETGIVVGSKNEKGHFFILEDLSCKASVQDWVQIVIKAAHRHQVEAVVVEINQGGELIASVLHSAGLQIPIKPVRATMSKAERAQPVCLLYQQKLVTHVRVFPQLEEQMLNFAKKSYGASPDRVDALIWCLAYLSNLHHSKPPTNVWSIE